MPVSHVLVVLIAFGTHLVNGGRAGGAGRGPPLIWGGKQIFQLSELVRANFLLLRSVKICRLKGGEKYAEDGENVP